MERFGVCSISFRDKSAEEIIVAAKMAGLDGIEWGSDVHVMPNDPDRAKQIREKMDAAGLITLSYGTYFGIEEMEQDSLDGYLDTADILGTDTLRIWPPKGNREQISQQRYDAFVAFAGKIALQAKKKNKILCLERHPDMLTEHATEALQFVQDVGMDNLRMYWQPVQFADLQTNLESAKILAEQVERIHVFHWIGMDRYPLADGAAPWQRYASVLKQRKNKPGVYLLEFMHDDRLESLSEAAASLKQILSR